MACQYSINIKGKLLELNKPLVMGIVNVTNDSFYSPSRIESKEALLNQCSLMLSQGADVLDLGACSTRPLSEPVSEPEELKRLHWAMDVIDEHFPQAIISIDTYRSNVVNQMVQSHKVSIVNDISGFAWDNAMLNTIAHHNLPYILTHCRNRAGETPKYDDFIPDVIRDISFKLQQLRQSGVSDVIIDPGFGFGKSVEENYKLMDSLDGFSIFEAPILVGVSRKSMIAKLLNCSSEDALNGTTILNTISLLKGVNIIRVHDVTQAVEVVKIVATLKTNKITNL